jgi:hypothetical protein
MRAFSLSKPEHYELSSADLFSVRLGHLITRLLLVFSRCAFEFSFDVLGLGRVFFESLVYTFGSLFCNHALPRLRQCDSHC